MKLYLLEPVENLGRDDDPWEPWFDKAFGFIVRAKNEEQARHFASEDAGDENRDGHEPWLDPKYTSCVELEVEGELGIVMKDFHAA